MVSWCCARFQGCSVAAAGVHFTGWGLLVCDGRGWGGAGCREPGENFPFGCDGVKLFSVGGILESGLMQCSGVEYSGSPGEGVKGQH